MISSESTGRSFCLLLRFLTYFILFEWGVALLFIFPMSDIAYG